MSFGLHQLPNGEGAAATASTATPQLSTEAPTRLQMTTYRLQVHQIAVSGSQGPDPWPPGWHNQYKFESVSGHQNLLLLFLVDFSGILVGRSGTTATGPIFLLL
jgi:hypothetical protein